MFYYIVFGEAIKVDSSSIPAEKNAGEGQKIGQWFREVVYALYCLDESVYREVPAVAIANAS